MKKTALLFNAVTPAAALQHKLPANQPLFLTSQSLVFTCQPLYLHGNPYFQKVTVPDFPAGFAYLHCTVKKESAFPLEMCQY